MAHKQLINITNIKIIINNNTKNPIITPTNKTLLNTLSTQKIFIPSTYNNNKTYNVYKIIIKNNNNSILPTEHTHINHNKEQKKCHLSYQIKIKKNIHIKMEPKIFNIKKWTYKVHSNHNITTFIKELILKLPKKKSVPFHTNNYIQIEYPPHITKFTNFIIKKKYHTN